MLFRIKKLRAVIIVLLLLVSQLGKAQFGGTLAMDGMQQSVATPGGMMNGATVFTVEFFIKTTENRSNSTYWQRPTMIGSASAGGPSGDFGITTDNGYIGMWSGLNNSGDNAFLSTSVQINNNNWHHIAAVNNGSIINLFVDGVNVGNITSGMGLITNAAPLTIGSSSLDFAFSNNVGISNFFHQGVYDEVRFSNSVRYTTNFTVPTAAFTPDGNTVALYHLDACVNSLVPDASANANNASPHNFTGACALTLPSPPNIPANNSITNVQKAEYFFDTDPGFGSGTNIPVTTATDISFTTAVNTQPLTTGSHKLYVRTQDASSHWSITNNSYFFIVPVSVLLPATTAPSRIFKAEYFFDTDPGFGNAIPLPVSPTFDLANSNFTVNTSSLISGVHRIYLRTQDSAKSWSISNMATFYLLPNIVTLPANPAPANIVKAEYFLDNDPGFGNGTDIPLTQGTDITLSNTFINITGLANGVHYLHLRTKDTNGTWSQNNFSNFSIVAASITLPPNPVPGNITKFEYFFDTDPGFGNGQAITISPTTDLQNFSFVADVSTLTNATHTLYVRSFDGWGLTSTKTFTKGIVLPLTWLSFSAKGMADSVLLNWQTTNEVNNHHFVIERSSDGRDFTAIGTLPAATNATSIHDYQLTDNHPLQGISYYRIRQIDVDGKENYSAVIAVRFGKLTGSITIYPNPAKEVVKIVFATAPASNTMAEIINASGQVVKLISIGRQSTVSVQVSDLPNGIYQFKIKGDNTGTEQIIIQH